MSKRAAVTALKTPAARHAYAYDDLLATVYDELRRIAVRYMRRERADHTLQPTALVHEAYLRIVDQEEFEWRNEEQFVAIAAMMMRRVLLNYAKGHNRDKRGGNVVKISFDESELGINAAGGIDVLALNEALERMSRDYEQESQVVELRFFGGLSILETAKVMGISESTVERDWKFARTWLLRELGSNK